MFMQQDWLTRQIQGLAAVLARVLFGKSGLTYEIEDELILTQTDQLSKELFRLIDLRRFGTAEDQLFAGLDPDDGKGLILAVDFFERLNSLSDAELEENGYSREEIDAGLHRAMALYQVEIPGY